MQQNREMFAKRQVPSGKSPYLMPDLIEYGNHPSHMGNGEDRVQQLPLLLMVVPYM